ncbi:MAG: hypothetical protein JW716_02205 [Candidatus Aenigmarchaeota archaeon]|nr:hypothetical protein [Candidatus Aenigmarchaeota archaeon]
MKKLLLPIIFLLVVSTVSAAEHSLQVTLKMNNEKAWVYLPGHTPQKISSLTIGSFTNVMHYYVCSYDDADYNQTLLSGLAHQLYTPHSIIVDTDGASYYTMTMNQSFNRSMVYAVFSRGDYRRFDSVIDYIEKGVFMDKPEPSFGFGLGKLHDIKMYITYDTIDLIGNRMALSKGEKMLMVSNNGTISNKAGLLFRLF